MLAQKNQYMLAVRSVCSVSRLRPQGADGRAQRAACSGISRAGRGMSGWSADPVDVAARSLRLVRARIARRWELPRFNDNGPLRTGYDKSLPSLFRRLICDDWTIAYHLHLDTR